MQQSETTNEAGRRMQVGPSVPHRLLTGSLAPGPIVLCIFRIRAKKQYER
jgi:hypothetical protein